MHDVALLSAELHRILEEEVEVYQELVELQQTERRLLVGRLLEPFVTNLHAKEHRLHTVVRLEQRRRTVLQNLLPLLGLSVPTVTLRQLCASLPEPIASKLGQARERLQTIIATLQQCNQDNARLLQDSLTLIAATLTFFSALAPGCPTYQRSGVFVAPTQGQLLSGRA
jgi:flagellar biosynthesis/type III secretory pathway chaperone